MSTSPPLSYQCPHVPQLTNATPYSAPILLQTIQDSAALGCLFCPILLAAVAPLFPSAPASFLSPRIHVIDSFPTGLRLSISYETHENEGKSSAPIEVFCDADITSNLIPTSRPTSTRTDDETAFTRLLDWSRTCIKTHHVLCTTMSSNPGLLPHRILALSAPSITSSPPSTPRISLKIPASGETGAYACLSHNWGGFQPLRTLTSTLEAHKQDIPWDALPKTFHDAVTITLRLNLKYIWIDSLCILQDSAEDWSVESSLMASIYRNATITLSAAASKGPDDGLFVDVPERYRASKLDPDFVARPQRAGGPTFWSRQPIDHDRKKQPLLSRGWVHQERLLSPRVIHFGASELVWECMQTSSCECGTTPSRLTWFNEKRDFHPLALSNLPLPFTAFTWRKVVQDFCGLTLSFPDDVFPAVSGAAKILRQTLEKRGLRAGYIAGLWECWFVEDCLWSVGKPGRRPEVWRAPTWSWASVVPVGMGRLLYRSTPLFESAWKRGEDGIDEKAMSVYASLVKSTLDMASTDDTGRIRAASAFLTGPLMRAKLVGDEVRIEGDKIGGWPEFQPDYDFSVPGRYHVASDADIWCLQLVSLRLPLDDPKHEYLWLLVLRQTEVESDGTVVYERLGLLRYRESFDKERPVERWFNAENVFQGAMVKIV